MSVQKVYHVDLSPQSCIFRSISISLLSAKRFAKTKRELHTVVSEPFACWILRCHVSQHTPCLRHQEQGKAVISVERRQDCGGISDSSNGRITGSRDCGDWFNNRAEPVFSGTSASLVRHSLVREQ